MKQTKDRRHLYVYTVKLLPEGITTLVEAYNIEQAAHKLSKKLDEIIYIKKEVLS